MNSKNKPKPNRNKSRQRKLAAKASPKGRAPRRAHSKEIPNAQVNPSRYEIYTRCATLQTETSNQIEASAHAAKTHLGPGSILVGVFEDIGISGVGTTRRPAWKKLLQLVQSKKIDVIAVRGIDRISRDPVVCREIEKQLRSAGVTIVSANGLLTDVQRLRPATSLRRMLADKAVLGMTVRAKKGLWKGGIPPYGFTFDGKQLVQDPEPARRVRLIFETFAHTKSLLSTVAVLSSKGLMSPPAANLKGGNGPRVNRKFVAMALSNPTYVGYVPGPRAKIELTKHILPDLEHKGRPYFKGRHKAVVSSALWQKVQRILDDRPLD